ncbi:MAG: SUMF1/EgtB/PvdO family nonheme iron enzyme [Planctomycetaceae bacterium]|nr:SUMF1/EgtB/PvdO family nonheme iron enzyme [Planctomycetaceae bacterium]
MANHPSKDELSAFLFGKLPLDKCDDVASHVEICPPCQETVNQLETEPDTLLDSLRRSSEPAPIDSACQRALERAVTFVGGSADAPSITESVASKSGDHDTQQGQAATAKPDNSMPDFSVSAVSNDAPRIPTTAEIVANLKAANLLTDDDWNTIQPHIAAATDGLVLIKRLLELGALTKFQAQLVYQGKTRGLSFGEYLVLDRIGAGGMGQVFKARHRRMDRLVALKVMASAAMKDQEAVKRFQREAKAAARLIHPNIVTAFDAGENGGVHFLVMEFVDGHDLSGYIKEHGPLAVPQAVDAVLQAARGLAFAHAEGVVHRDIKPANLLRDKKGVVRVLDMGLARFDDPLGKGKDDGLTSSGAVMGTVDYMAPEQAFNTRDAGPAADVYSLGCTLYRLLTGQSLYNGETVVQKILAHREQAIPSLSSGSQTIPAALEKLYERMVAKKWEDRPTMVEIVQELERIARGELSSKIVIDTQSAASTGNAALVHSASAGRGGKRPPVKWLAAAAGAAALLFLGVWVIIRDKDGNEVARFKAPDGATVTMQNDAPAAPATDKTSVAVLPSPAAVASSQPQPEPTPVQDRVSFKTTAVVDNDLPPWNLPIGAPQPALTPFSPDQAKELQTAWAKHLGRPAVQENSLGMSLALIPPGEFDAVFTQPDDSMIKPELTRRRVRLSQAFDLGVTEVTVAQFRQFVDATGYRTDAETNGKGGYPVSGESKSEWTWKSPGSYKQTDDMPVVQVSWNDASAFCDWLSKKEGARYRLPTEAEWEFACRAGSVSYHAVCEKSHELTQHAWVKENGSLGGSFVRPVRNWQANAFGLFDVLGNAWEWCADGGDRGSVEWTHAVDPWGYFFYPNVRGCGFDVAAKDVHPAFRRKSRYELQRSSIGFRVLRQVSTDSPPGPLDRPLLVKRNSQLFQQALVAKPAPIDGLRSWSVELGGSGHIQNGTQATVWSPQGDRIATSNYNDPVVRLWDRNGTLVQMLTRQRTFVPRMTFSPDGQWLVTVCEEQISIWNVATGGCHAVIPNTLGGRPAFSPDGQMLAVCRGSQTMFQTLDLKTGRILGVAGGVGTTGGGAAGDYIAWSPDGKTIATVNVGDSISFHMAPGLERTERVPVDKRLYMVAWSPDGKWLAAAEFDGDRNVLIFDAHSRTLKATLDRKKVGREVCSLSWSKDSRRILEGGSIDRYFIIWDALTGTELVRSTGGGGPASWSPDEQEVVVGGTPLRIFDPRTGLLKRTGPDVGRSVSAGTGSSSGACDAERLFVRHVISPNSISIFNSQTGVLIDRWEKLPSGRFSLSPTQDLIAIFDKGKDKNLFVIDAATGKQLRELKTHPDEIRAVAWSPDGRLLASGGKDKVVRIWNVADTKLKYELPGHQSEIYSLAWSPDGKQLASSDAISVRLWDPAQGSLMSTHHASKALFTSSNALAWTPDGQSLWVPLSAGGSTAVRLNVVTDTWSKPDPGPNVTGFFPSPDSRHWLLSVSNQRFTYRRGESSQTAASLQAEFKVSHWHPDSRRVVGGINGIGWIRGYNVETDQPLGVIMPAIIGNNWLVVGPEGHYNGPKGIEDHLVYVAQTDAGEQVTLSPAEFSKRYGWKNDPAQARLLGP